MTRESAVHQDFRTVERNAVDGLVFFRVDPVANVDRRQPGAILEIGDVDVEVSEAVGTIAGEIEAGAIDGDRGFDLVRLRVQGRDIPQLDVVRGLAKHRDDVVDACRHRRKFGPILFKHGDGRVPVFGVEGRFREPLDGDEGVLRGRPFFNVGYVVIGIIHFREIARERTR